MKPSFGALLLCAFVVTAVQARATVLPDACGSDKVRFDVTTQLGQPLPAAPEAGKARIVFIETTTGMSVTSRIGMDGAWVGADQGNSYFALDVTPGVHHLCANWQSTFAVLDKNIALFPLTAEPGKVYYIRVKIMMGKDFVDFDLAPVNEDEARYLIKVSALSAGTPKK